MRNRQPYGGLLLHTGEITGNHHDQHHKNHTWLVVFPGWEGKWVDSSCQDSTKHFCPHELAITCTHYCKTSQLKWRKLIYTSPWTRCFLALCKLQNTHVAKPRFASGLCCFCLMQLSAVFHISVSLCIYACMILLHVFNSTQSMLLCFFRFSETSFCCWFPLSNPECSTFTYCVLSVSWMLRKKTLIQVKGHSSRSTQTKTKKVTVRLSYFEASNFHEINN